MANIPDSIKILLNKYIEALNKNGIKIKSAFLFGSYVKGSYSDLSDIDVAIISDAFEGIRFYDRKKIRKITLSISSNLEVIPFTPDDFSMENPLAKEIMDSGIQIA